MDVHLVHSAGVALIVRAKAKTDERNAEVLAQLLRTVIPPRADGSRLERISRAAPMDESRLKVAEGFRE